MSEARQDRSETTGRHMLGAPQLVFFVIAAAAPLGFSVGAIPLGLGRGGIGLVGGFLVIAILLAVFAVGYVAMARYMTRPGGLFEFVGQGLGRPLGVGAAFVAVLTYAVAATGAIGIFAVFADSAANDILSLDLPWTVWAVVGTVVMATLGITSVDVNARVLGVIIATEVAVLIVVAVAIIVQGGADGLTVRPFAPAEVFNNHIGVTAAVTLSAFAGFEATVIYSGEVRDRSRTIRRATFAAIFTLAALYILVSWSLIVAYGNDQAAAAAASNPVAFFLGATQTYLGSGAVKILEVLIVLSWFASVLAFHNATARYLSAMGRQRIVPAFLGATHSRFESPWRASLLHSGFTLAAIVLTAVLGGDPYLDLYVLGSTPAVIGIPLLELLASVAIVAFFIRDRRGQGRLPTLVAPAVAAIAFALLLYAVISEVDLFTARTGAVNTVLWGVLFLALVAGTIRGFVMPRGPQGEDRPIASTDGLSPETRTTAS